MTAARLRVEVVLAAADPWFHVCLHEAAANIELLREFDRLYGTRFATRASPIDRKIDEATGKTDDDMRKFVEFVYDCIYTRLHVRPRDLSGSV